MNIPGQDSYRVETCRKLNKRLTVYTLKTQSHVSSLNSSTTRYIGILVKSIWAVFKRLNDY